MLPIESKGQVGVIRMTIQEREWWGVSRDLFRGGEGAPRIDIYDFRTDDWRFFLDNVNSLGDLLEGLRQLSPLVDDALEVAEQMDEQDFRKFKKALIKERQGEKAMPRKYGALLIPEGFPLGALIAEKFEVSLGTALIQLERIAS